MRLSSSRSSERCSTACRLLNAAVVELVAGTRHDRRLREGGSRIMRRDAVDTDPGEWAGGNRLLERREQRALEGSPVGRRAVCRKHELDGQVEQRTEPGHDLF